MSTRTGRPWVARDDARVPATYEPAVRNGVVLLDYVSGIARS